MAENNCVVCFKNVNVYSVGECDHPVCYECSTRMRVLCRQNECPICRHEMSAVIFTEKIRPFRRLKRRYALYDSHYHIAFDNSEILEMYEILLQYSCNKCHKKPVFDSFEILNEHMRKTHDLFWCDLCADNLKIFPSEMRYYTKSELSRHRQIGDVDDRSHRGHPLCEFCNVRFMDRDELYRHLRKLHLFCHICDSEGIQQFYGQYNMLRDHYRSDHFLCEEDDCIQETLTSVFSSEIDLKAHKAVVHCKNLRNKQAVKQARTLELEFHLAPRSRRPVNQEFGEIFPGGQSTQVKDNGGQSFSASWDQEFPSLTTEAPFVAPRPQITRDRSNRYALNEQNFPALGSEMNILPNFVDSRPVSSSSMRKSPAVAPTNISVQQKSKKMTNNKRRDEPMLAIAGPSTSTLSLTWVKKTKEKKAPPEAIANPTKPYDSVAKPPLLSRKNFPTLQTGAAVAATELKQSPKKKKIAGAVHNNETEQKKSATSNGDVSKVENQRKSASSETRPTSAPSSMKNDDKTACFLLNATRKKVKMKSDSSPSLEENSNMSKTHALPKSVSHSRVPCSSAQSKVEKDKANSTNPLAKGNNRHCDSDSSDRKIRKSENREISANKTSKDSETKTTNDKGKENVAANATGANKKQPQSYATCNGKENVSVKERRHNQPDTKQKSKSETKKTETVRKKSDTVSEQQSSTSRASKNSAKVDGSKETVKKPPGLDKPRTAPPPGIAPMSESSAANFPSLMADPLFVYQQPQNFALRNSALIRKITSSLPKRCDEALNELKSTSLLFREGLLPAAAFYHYCRDKFKGGDFDDIFIELIVLLPNIPKQQELMAIHVASSPTNSLLSRIHTCQICLQILLTDDMLYHYSQHTANLDPSLLCTNESN